MSNSQQQPAEIVELIAAAFERHAAALELYARQLCDAPEDAVQEAFIELARQRTRPTDVAAWLYRVVRNRAISLKRSIRRRRLYEARALMPTDYFQATPEETIDAESAQRALASLPADQREAIVARIWGELTFRQIAEVMGVTDSTAHRRYQDGLQTIRNQLGESCPHKMKSS